MQKKYGNVILVVASIFVLIGIARFISQYINLSPGIQGTLVTAASPPVDPCLSPKYEHLPMVMTDRFMKGLLEVGENYTVIKGWYRCNPVKQGDIVYYRYHTEKPPVPRLVTGVSGDKFKLVKDQKHSAWNLLVNDKLVTHPDGKAHYFGNGNVPHVLSLFHTSMKGVLAPSTHVIFTTVSHGIWDSNMGVVNTEDFMGKVEVIRNPQNQN